jgi:GTP cyclohydrolase I
MSGSLGYSKEEHYNEQALEKLKFHYGEILRLIGEDPSREGLVRTPGRVAEAWGELTQG